MRCRGRNRCFFWEKYKTHKYSVGRKCNYWMLSLLVHHATSRLYKNLHYINYLLITPNPDRLALYFGLHINFRKHCFQSWTFYVSRLNNIWRRVWIINQLQAEILIWTTVSTYVPCFIVIPVFNSSAALCRIILKEFLSFQKIKKKNNKWESIHLQLFNYCKQVGKQKWYDRMIQEYTNKYDVMFQMPWFLRYYRVPSLLT